MRESQDKILVPNQLTPETSAPLLFNLLWWKLGRLEALTGRISMYSYSIYLCHFPLLFVFLHFFPVRGDSTSAHVAAVVRACVGSSAATRAPAKGSRSRKTRSIGRRVEAGGDRTRL